MAGKYAKGQDPRVFKENAKRTIQNNDVVAFIVHKR